jgi:pyocin large subunit-like protein
MLGGNAAARVFQKFASEAAFEAHFAKHAAEWGAQGITKAEYLARAQALLTAKPGGNILSFTRAGGDILRYNTATNEFAVGSASGAIRTFFRPQDGMQYWVRQVGP